MSASDIAYQIRGNGPALVLISGLGGLGAFWDPVQARLSEHYSVITFDHPGTGKSQRVAPQHIDAIVAAVLDILHAEQIESAHFVGHSTGSIVTQAIALDHRERCARIVLSGGWARVDARFRDLFAYRKFLLQKVGGAAYTALSQLGGYDGRWYSEHLAKPGVPDFEAVSSIDIDTVVSRIDMLLGYERADELGKLDIETLVIGASDDFIVPLYHSEDLARRIPGARLVQTMGGHFFPQVDPGAFSEQIMKFLGGR